MRRLSFVFMLAATGAGLPVAAMAQGRPDTLSMSCAQAASIVQRNGEAVLGTGPYLFERYVRGQGFCTRNEEAHPAWVSTGDNRQCFVGYRCVPIDIDSRR